MSVSRIKDKLQAGPPPSNKTTSPLVTQRPTPLPRTNKPNGHPPPIKAKPQMVNGSTAPNGHGPDIKTKVPMMPPPGGKPVLKPKPVLFKKTLEDKETCDLGPGVSILRDIQMLQGARQVTDKETDQGSSGKEETENEKPENERPENEKSKPNRIKQFFAGAKSKGTANSPKRAPLKTTSDDSNQDSPKKMFNPLIPFKLLSKGETPSELADKKTKSPPAVPHHRLPTEEASNEGSPPVATVRNHTNVTSKPEPGHAPQAKPPSSTVPYKGVVADYELVESTPYTGIVADYEVIEYKPESPPISSSSKPKAQPYKVTTIVSASTPTSATPTASPEPLPKYSTPIPKSQRNQSSVEPSSLPSTSNAPPISSGLKPKPNSKRNSSSSIENKQLSLATPTPDAPPSSSGPLPEYSTPIPKSQRNAPPPPGPPQPVVVEKPLPTKARTCYENVFLNQSK